MFKIINSSYRLIINKGVSLLSIIKRHKKLSAFSAVLLAVVAFSITGSIEEDEQATTDIKNPSVEVQSIRDMSSGRTFTSVGTVESVSEARLQTESGGRVTAVYAKIGDIVNAGSILATLENASERASLLQAEGAYESAQAAAAQSNVGTREADIRLNDARLDIERVSNSVYGTVQDVLVSKIDPFYANPNSSYPSLRIATLSNTKFLSDERIAIQVALKDWDSFEFTITQTDSLYQHADFVKQQLEKLVNLVDIFRTAVNDDKNDSRYSDAERDSLNSDLALARTQLIGAQNSIEASKSELMNAVEAVERAQISSTGGITSSADAQLKQALGAYRSAQANYERTVVRTPISGVVNAFYLKAGEYVSPSAPAVIVANNNNGLEINTSVNQEDSVKIAVGDMVVIDKTATGTISAIAGAIDPTTGKVAVKISIDNTSEVKNGTAVSVKYTAKEVKQTTEISIPLSAIKMTGSGPVVFTVTESNQLKDLPVVLGPVSGSEVVIEEGVTLDTEIVVDARGLKAGTEVTVITK